MDQNYGIIPKLYPKYKIISKIKSNIIPMIINPIGHPIFPNPVAMAHGMPCSSRDPYGRSQGLRQVQTFLEANAKGYWDTDEAAPGADRW